MIRDVIALPSYSNVLRFELQVEADNPRAIAFYGKLGFEHEGVQRKAYKRAAEAGYVDEIVMVKFVGSLAE
jgi:putative acetyltransferase